jgi:hypothetical protein
MKYFGNISFVKMESSNLVNYLTNMCQNDQDTIVLQPWNKLHDKGKLNHNFKLIN